MDEMLRQPMDEMLRALAQSYQTGYFNKIRLREVLTAAGYGDAAADHFTLRPGLYSCSQPGGCSMVCAIRRGGLRSFFGEPRWD